MDNSKRKPLEGIRVLDLTVALSGPYGSMLLGGLGAEVIRIESPKGGDIARTNPPFVGSDGLNFGTKKDDEVSLTVLNRARNKKSVTLDLKSDKGCELFLALAKQSDVIIQNMSEGTVDKLGIGYDAVRAVNPKIIYASISAFGDPSIYPGLKGMDIIVQALSGIMETCGEAGGAPVRFGLPIADLVAPQYTVQGILAAYIERLKSGEGQHVKVSMLDCLASWVAEEHFDVFQEAGYPLKTGNFHDRLVPFGVYPCKDGSVAIGAFSEVWMKGLVDALDRHELLEDPRFSTRGPRMKNAAAFNAIIQEWTEQHTAAEIVHELLEKRNVPAAKVRTPLEVLNDSRMHERGAVVPLEHPVFGNLGAFGMGLPIQFSRSTAAFDQPATDLGMANNAVFGDLLNLTDAEIQELKASGII